MFEDFLIKYEGGDLTYQNHDLDNSVYMCSNVTEFKKRLELLGYLYLGITDKYDYHSNNYGFTNLAMVFKNQDDEVFWIHFMSTTVHHWIWNELAPKYGKEEAYEKANEICDKFCEENNVKF